MIHEDMSPAFFASTVAMLGFSTRARYAYPYPYWYLVDVADCVKPENIYPNWLSIFSTKSTVRTMSRGCMSLLVSRVHEKWHK